MPSAAKPTKFVDLSLIRGPFSNAGSLLEALYAILGHEVILVLVAMEDRQGGGPLDLFVLSHSVWSWLAAISFGVFGFSCLRVLRFCISQLQLCILGPRQCQGNLVYPTAATNFMKTPKMNLTH